MHKCVLKGGIVCACVDGVCMCGRCVYVWTVCACVDGVWIMCLCLYVGGCVCLQCVVVLARGAQASRSLLNHMAWQA